MTKLKLEYCKMCDEPTGRAGAGDDSIYLDDGRGPLCERCYGDFKSADMLAADAQQVAKTCVWALQEFDEMWESGCGESWSFIDGGPAENNIRFCHGCGKLVDVYLAAGARPNDRDRLADERLAGMAAMAVWEEEP